MFSAKNQRAGKQSEVSITQRIYALQHIETAEFICLLQDGTDFLACFSDGDTAIEFRTALGLQEHVDIVSTTVESSPFTHFWLDGKNMVIPKTPALAA
jgi:hypothetical protein